MNKKEFDEWIGKMLEWKPKYYTCWNMPKSPMIVCVNEKNGKVGVARCHPDDKFIVSYGKAIAIARCAGKEVPTLSEYKTIRELQNGNVFMYKGKKYRYIGKISEHSHAVVNAHDILVTFYDYGEEVEICS